MDKIGFLLPRELKQRFKLLAAKRGATMSELLMAYVVECMESEESNGHQSEASAVCELAQDESAG